MPIEPNLGSCVVLNILVARDPVVLVEVHGTVLASQVVKMLSADHLRRRRAVETALFTLEGLIAVESIVVVSAC